jgi:hypothetical protein
VCLAVGSVGLGGKDFERSVAKTRVSTLEMESAIGLADSSARAGANVVQLHLGNTESPVWSARARGLYDGHIRNELGGRLGNTSHSYSFERSLPRVVERLSGMEIHMQPHGDECICL